MKQDGCILGSSQYPKNVRTLLDKQTALVGGQGCILEDGGAQSCHREDWSAGLEWLTSSEEGEQGVLVERRLLKSTKAQTGKFRRHYTVGSDWSRRCRWTRVQGAGQRRRLVGPRAWTFGSPGQMQAWTPVSLSLNICLLSLNFSFLIL